MRKAIKVSLTLIASAAAAVGGLTTTASATPTNLLANGGFEGTSVSGPYTTYGTTYGTGADLGGWTVDSGSVDVIGSYWQPAEGLQSLDLSGNEPGSISQTVATIPGVTYHLSFSLAGNPDGNATYGVLHDMSVTWGGAGVTGSPFTSDSTGATESSMNWATQGADVIATGTSMTLAFSALDPGPYGPALDNVVLTQSNTGSVVTNTAPSQGSFTNNKATAVFHAVVTSADPSCVIGRPVTFVIPGLTTGTTVLTDATGLASLKEIVGVGSYNVTTSVATTPTCGTSTAGPTSYSFAVKH